MTRELARGPLTLSMTGIVLLVSVSANALAEQQPSKKGLAWVRFNSPDFTRPWDVGVDAQVNMDTANTIEAYSKLWRGCIKLPVDGTIIISAEADDGLELWIGDDCVIRGWGKGQARQGRIVVNAPRLLPLEIRYFQNGGVGHLRLYWSWQGRERELIPASVFLHNDKDAEVMAAMKDGRTTVPPRHKDRSAIYRPATASRSSTAAPIRLAKGPYLLVDDYLIQQSTNITRVLVQPKRNLPGPVVTGSKGRGDDCFQPYLEVIRDARTKRFRIWYGVPESASQSHVAYMESDDGINWIRPHRVLVDASKIQFGISVIDEGHDYADPAKRFKLGYYGQGGLRVATSSDGLGWTLLTPRTVLPHQHDINNIYRDPARNRYMAIVSTYITGDRWSGQRRVTMQSVSDDLVTWRTPWLIVTPDDSSDKGETQFYAVCGFLRRGDLLIGMVKVLRDDLPADAGGPVAGIGYTSLAWTRDGMSWTRDQEVFFDRHPQKGQWDHAMSWIDCQLPVGDEVYLYYGGYARGHKTNRFEERQIGLVRMQRDRYVARRAGHSKGLLRTPSVIIDGDAVNLNVDASKGEIRVQVLGADGQAVKGLTFADCRPIRTNSLAAPVKWRGRLGEAKGRPVHLEFSLQSASLFAFEVK